MFDKKKNLNIKSKVEQNEDIIKKLEALKKQIISKRDELQDSCSHDLVLCYGIESDGQQFIKKGRCLTCGNYFELDGTFDMFTERDVDKNSIVDVTDILEISNRIIHGRSMVYLRAKDKFEELLRSKKDLSLASMKIEIINDLIIYERDIKVKKLARVKID